MIVNAVSPAMSGLPCQPIKQIGFLGGKDFSDDYIRNEVMLNGDEYRFENKIPAEEKYEFACRLAAYYKDKYENLLESGCCIA